MLISPRQLRSSLLSSATAFDELDEDQQALIKYLITIAYALHPEDNITEHDQQLLAGALFGPSHASESLLAITRILTDNS